VITALECSDCEETCEDKRRSLTLAVPIGIPTVREGARKDEESRSQKTSWQKPFQQLVRPFRLPEPTHERQRSGGRRESTGRVKE